MAFATKGTWWRVHRANVLGQNLRGLVDAGLRWVVVGDNGLAPIILTCEAADEQANLPTFTSRTPNGSDFLTGVAYVASGALVAACGANGRIESSTDRGITWSSVAVAGTPDFYGIIGVSGDATSRFVAVGVDEIWGQDSGGTWTQRWSGSQVWRSVAHRSGLGWVAVGDNGWASHSPTGAAASWTAPFNFAIGDLQKIAVNNSYFMAIDDAGYVYRSATGFSGSWTLIKNFSQTTRTVVPLLTSGSWVAFSQGFDAWITTDDGTTWTLITPDPLRATLDAWNQGQTVMTSGYDGSLMVSYSQLQEDFESTAESQEPPPAFGANADMAGDAVRRLVGQFRSSS